MCAHHRFLKNLTLAATMITAMGALAQKVGPGRPLHLGQPSSPSASHRASDAAAPNPACPNPSYTLAGVDFSPYEDGQDPNVNPVVSPDQIRARMRIIAPCTNWVRTYSVTNGLEAAGAIAHSLNLKIAAGAWVDGNSQNDQKEINNLITMALNGQADLLIVGTEALLRNNLTASQLVGYIQQVKQAVQVRYPNIPVATDDVFSQLLLHPDVVAACDVLLVNYYPYWSGVPIDSAVSVLSSWHKQMLSAAGGKPVIVGETGWPSGGNTVGTAIPSPANASYYFLDLVSWARANQVFLFYFEAFDEAWKAKYEGPQGSHWGIWDKDGRLKTGMDAVFAGWMLPNNWSGLPGGPGTPSLILTYVPPYGASGSDATLAGQVLHADTSTNSAVVYLSVDGGSTWWVKPYHDEPITGIGFDGKWSAPIDTGGADYDATNVAAFLIPNTYSPPLLSGQPLPGDLDTNSLANVQVRRSANSISGVVSDTKGNGISATTLNLTGPDTQTAVTVGGKYSFYSLSACGPYTVTPSVPNWTFNPSSETIPCSSGNQTANFVATSAPPLVVSASPRAGTGRSQILTVTYADIAGYGDIDDAYVGINSNFEAANGCFVRYLQPSNSLYLLNDAGVGELGPLTPGTPGDLSNSQCTVNGPATIAPVVTPDGLTMTLALSAGTGFLGVKHIYMSAQDTAGQKSGWHAMGTWTPQADTPPSADSVTPNPATGASQRFSLAYSVENGNDYTDLSAAFVTINSILSAANACAVRYYQSTDALYLMNDDATLAFGPLAPGKEGILGNSQCWISGKDVSVAGSGKTLTLRLLVNAKPGFFGKKNIYMWAQDSEGLNSGWQNRGLWTIRNDRF